ncbi:MAG TPA: site-2 protease family protein [Candidatus Paceibacterota bacterium]|nr:site-2 protease family protein [Candidatus Paceibacterota bacterium]
MGFLFYDIAFLVIFTTLVVLFLYKKRKSLQREGPLFLYKTKIGIKAINYFSKKYEKQLRWIQYLSIITGYILMIIILYLFIQIVYIYAIQPDTVRAIKIPPVMPLIPYLPAMFKVSFLPPFYFIYWILILAVVAISHEFAHGIFAKFHKIKVKATGFGFLGPFLAAFVEPDEKRMEKLPIKKQLSILSAGTFANILISLLFIIIFIIFFWLMFMPAGAIFNTYTFREINVTQIDWINSKNITYYSQNEILNNLDINNKNNLTKIIIDDKSYLISNEYLIDSINQSKEIMIAYEDMPAINVGLSGAIIEFNGIKVRNTNELINELKKYSPGDNVEIKTKIDKNIKEYDITLAAKPTNKNAAYLGIGLLESSRKGIAGKIYSIISIIRQPGTYYESKIGSDLTVFIQDFLWWMILINISVALVNMLPLGIFDGGKVFYLTVLYFAKSEDIAKKSFKAITMLLLFLLGIMMLFWFFSMFI